MLNEVLGKKVDISRGFSVLFPKVYSAIKDKNFNQAVQIYNEIFSKYSLLNEKQRPLKLSNDLTLLFNEITLYLRLNNAYLNAINNNLKFEREELEKLHDLAHEVHKNIITPIQLEPVEKDYKFCLQIYTKNPRISDFELLTSEIEKSIINKNFNETILNYTQANLLLAKIMPFLFPEKKTELYFKIRKIFKNIILHNLTIPQKSKISRKSAKKDNAYEFTSFEATYQKIQDALKKGDMKTATKLYKYL